MHDPLIRTILAEFGLDAARARIEPRNSSGGFSGALFWKVDFDGKCYCLRRWPPQVSLPKLDLIHRTLLHAARKGCDFLPVPLTHTSGVTHFRQEKHFWELTAWMAGKADFWSAELPTEEKTANLKTARLKNAARTLAQFHLAVADLEPVNHVCSPAIASRLSQLRQWLQGDAQNVRRAVEANRSRQLQIFKQDRLADYILDAFPLNAHWMETLLAAATSWVVPVQICIKDIWHDHILFTDERVTGVVDFGAMGIDTVAGDIARLFGSLVADDANMWVVAIDAYQTIRSLTPTERRLIGVFDQSTTLMSGLNWLNWIFRENRQFEDLLAVRKRLQQINLRLQNLARQDLVLE